jgi:ATP-dependent protease ClpP protease subunit
MPGMSHPWYSIRARAAQGARAASAEVYIYGDIGESWWADESVTAAKLVKELTEIQSDAITVRINSVGGSVSDGVAIYNALKRHPASITCVVDGVAASIASLIAMAGDTVEMASNAMLMIHAPWTYAGGNAADMRATADMLDAHAEAMATSYAAKTGKSTADVHRTTALARLGCTFPESIVTLTKAGYV